MDLPEFLVKFFNRQLENWDLASQNFQALNLVKKKPFKIGALEGYLQYNPARKGSTTAKVDSESIKKRKCFLCKENRPAEQLEMDIMERFQLLVNPFPILDYHFTIASTSHIPQKFSLETAVELAGKLPGMVVFYNDDGAGASAPDHLHYQAVPKDSLPLISLIDDREELCRNEEPDNISDILGLPFKILCGKFTKGKKFETDKPFNAYVWQTTSGKTLYLIIPRKAHRPDSYYKDPPERIAISPGAIDMAGIPVTPFEEDFNKTTPDNILEVYMQTGFSI